MLKKKPEPAKKDVVVEVETEREPLVCECGEPAAVHLGQNQVCEKHIRRA